MLEKSVEYIKSKIKVNPEIAIILGSGLGDFVDTIENKFAINYEDIPGFPNSTVVGHSGKLIFGNVGDKFIVAMQGRIHYYEGQGIDKTVYPMKVLCELGIKKLIVTNASGGVNKSFKPSDIMLIKDHINYTGVNPLIGKNEDDKGPRFLDMTYTYSKELRDKAKEVAKNIDLDIKEGVYMWFTGPCYETPSEVKLAAIVGADAVGMSTVPEVIIARHRGVDVLGFSCITNMAAGILEQPLNHEEVIEVSNKIKDKFAQYVREVIKVI
ncbi:purine-nucleoside phosphorylase [Peptoniphilus sp. oral taxon 386]|uniref:purine-nucleoside phosphorylase n=1 Tax=Peptoniphilus sp. oral taxon 386 TaxID=652713 RepID=UPI0001DA9AF2|nr:purine-nucleoside phosphorylase [Peptoniphilus sp. oral taxon 386]EFI42060.1 purine nucleoside phosphorylase I, inosine and guanosine-specific [Peptoniphilus sp. oral taxon 386 str. F0131]